MTKQMTKERLERFRKAQADVEALGRAAKVPVHDKVRGSMQAFPYTEVSITICGVDERLARRYREKKAKLDAEKQEVLDFVEGIDDLRIAQLVLLRYVDRKTWLEIWVQQGRIGTVDSHRKALLRFLGA